uniref:NACHT domain-containing protein n=1 Tax=Psilocybe cubensis TaxID=181762 RepID=A0A8H7XMD0_PSICU
MEWIDNPAPEKQALWLYGPAGAGKSAIGHSIAMMLQERSTDRRYGSSFFFAKGAPGRGDGNKLFSTIAHELAINFPDYRTILDTVMQENPTLPTKLINIQLQNLIIRPLTKVRNWPAHHPVVIIDGLDECSGEKRMQVAILSTIANAIIQHCIPLRFLIISRPEYWIADVFETGCFSSIVKRVSLRDDLEADAGIKTYLRSEFNRIYEENIEIMHSVHRPWPEDHLIDRFVRSASGQFVYASTVVKFIGDSLHCDPLEQLRILIRPGPHDALAFSELDQLYASILSSYPRWDALKRVLGAILCTPYSNSESVMEFIFNVSPPELRQILRSMRSLICTTESKCSPLLQRLIPTFGTPRYDTPWLSFHHLSFEEFIKDSSRSGKFLVNEWSTSIHAFCVIIRHLIELLHGNPDIDRIINRIGPSQYHLGFSFPTVSTILYSLVELPSSDMDIIIQELKYLHEALEGVLSEADRKIPRSKHTLWLLSTFQRCILRDQSWRESTPAQGLKPLLDLLQSLQRPVMLALTISAQQVLEATSLDGPILGYLVRQSWRRDTSSFDILDIGAEMHITNDAIVSELQDMHGIVNIFCYKDRGHVEIILDVFEKEIDKVSRTYLPPALVAEWETPGLVRVIELLNQLFNGTEATLDSPLNEVVRFLHNPARSDIRSREYLQNSHRMTILHILIHPQLPKLPQYLPQFANASLGWLHRQLTGTNRHVLEEHDSMLIVKFEAAAKTTFSALISLYIEHSSYFLTAKDSGRQYNHHIMGISPTLNGKYILSENIRAGGGTSELWLTWIRLFHSVLEINQLLGTRHPVLPIVALDWYPHLATFLLNVLVSKHYGSLDQGGRVYWMDFRDKHFLSLLQCMPYAIPTQENLTKIRLLHYIWHKLDRKYRWRPPSGFCDLTMQFLGKYNHKYFCGMEYDRLKSWLVKLKATESHKILDVPLDYPFHYEEYTTDEEG